MLDCCKTDVDVVNNIYTKKLGEPVVAKHFPLTTSISNVMLSVRYTCIVQASVLKKDHRITHIEKCLLTSTDNVNTNISCYQSLLDNYHVRAWGHLAARFQ